MATMETDVLIVGSGPAGASMGLFLSTYGVSNLIVTRYHRLVRTPRAHLTNQRTLEALRDVGVEDQVQKLGTPQHLIRENVFCENLAGREIGRIHSWGNHPELLARHRLSSPTVYCDLPQDQMEPLLVRNADLRGSRVRYNAEYLSHTQDDDGVTVQLKDRLTDQDFEVRCKYLYGADGGNSLIAKHCDLPMEGEMGLAGSMNIVFEADLSEYVAHRPSCLYWMIQSGSSVGGIGMGVLRMVRPWWRWLIVWGYDQSQGAPDLNEETCRETIYKIIGDDSVDIHIDSTSFWTVNNQYGKRMHDRRVFCGGDAMHRHPPTNGLGSNVSIQDSYNLAWKLALVLQGKAEPSMLESYSEERVPIAKQTVERANKSITDFYPIFGALGLQSTEDPKVVDAAIDSLEEASPTGAEKRAALDHAIAGTNYVYNAHGVEMNQRYRDSVAIANDGIPEPEFKGDPELDFEQTSWPGARVPHAWLRSGRYGKHVVSTVDLVGKGRFSILTGIGGEGWVGAAEAVGAAAGLEIGAFVVGPGRDYQDVYGDWARLREIKESGVLLIRPDAHVAWRYDSASDNATSLLASALGRVLGRTIDC
ncbi:MAG: FAD-dependent monooxygenase [Myxococcota bacterium]